jgi:acetoacetyl-CoA synthetase
MGKKLEVPVKRMLQGVPRAKVVSDGAVRDATLLDPFERLATVRNPTPYWRGENT